MNRQELKQHIEEIAQSDTLANDQCLVVFLLSHGDYIDANKAGRMYGNDMSLIGKEIIYGVDGNFNDVNSLLRPLTETHCHMLRGKPKLVFIQACRGGGGNITIYVSPLVSSRTIYVSSCSTCVTSCNTCVSPCTTCVT